MDLDGANSSNAPALVKASMDFLPPNRIFTFFVRSKRSLKELFFLTSMT